MNDKLTEINYEVEDLDLCYPEEDDSFAQADEVCNDPYAALAVSMDRFGRIDLPFMSRICGMTVQELISELAGTAMWQDPKIYDASHSDEEGWLIASQYLSGNLVRLLDTAEEMEEKYPGRFRENIHMIRSRVPEIPEIKDIYVSLGSNWVPAEFYQDFIGDLLTIPPEQIRLSYNSYTGKWLIAEKGRFKHAFKNRIAYGLIEMPALNIIENTMNALPVTVRYPVPGKKDKYTVNREMTLAAQEKQRAIIEKFDQFVRSDPEKADRLRACFAEAYEYTTTRYDGSFLKLKDLAPSQQLYPFQKDAIARILLSRTVLLAHHVGSGKTYEMVVSAHELNRIGLSSHTLIVVPNNVLDGAVSIHKKLYPDDSILVIRPKDFTPDKRDAAVEALRSGGYTAAYMAYSSFDMIGLSRKYREEELEARIRDLTKDMNKMQPGLKQKQVKQELDRTQRELKRFREKEEKDPQVCFETLNIDALMVDEAQNYKNITIPGSISGFSAIASKGSAKSDGMLRKVHYTLKNGGRVVFATGTPITNSLSDIFVLQTYLQQEELKLCGIDRFAQWANTFAERSESFEIDVDAANFRNKTRFSHFRNLPELISMFSLVTDFHEPKAGTENLPVFDGHTDIVVKKSKALSYYLDDIVARTERIRAHAVNSTEDILLKVTSDGRKAALDLRLAVKDVRKGDLGAETKVSRCAAEVKRIYDRYPDGTQVIFCDFVSVQQYLAAELVKAGIPESQFMCIHASLSRAKRDKAVRDLNEGKIRILCGSTQTLGTGVNIQNYLVAAHHLDVPWRPSDLKQREGRIIRQGNRNPKVFIYRYITAGSFDAYMWQLIENKQRFISDLLSGSIDPNHRSEEDIDEVVLSYSEIKALAIGNPLVKERVNAFNHLNRLQIARSGRNKELQAVRDLICTLPKKVDTVKRQIALIEQDISYVNAQRSALPGGKPLSTENAFFFGVVLLAELSENAGRTKEQQFSHYLGYDVWLPAGMKADKPYVLLRRAGSPRSYPVEMGDKAAGCVTRIDNALAKIPDEKVRMEKRLHDLEQQLSQARADLEKGNPFDRQVETAAEKLAAIDERLKNGNAGLMEDRLREEEEERRRQQREQQKRVVQVTPGRCYFDEERQCYIGNLGGTVMSLNKVWSGHAFTEQEAEFLFRGFIVVIDCVSRNGMAFSTAGKLMTGVPTPNGSTCNRFVPIFDQYFA
ncbi:MAG: helicase-related protein [Eubacterium sp.]|nr:helicase-related protein [Eubacterium sp.]